MPKEIAPIVTNTRLLRTFRSRIGLLLLFFASASYPASGDSGASLQIGCSGETAGFLDNLEYFNRQRPGETIFGASTKIRVFFHPSRYTFFSVGVFGLRRFGDERFLTRALPLFCARYSTDRFSLSIGEIAAAHGHGLPDMLYKRERVWDPGTEEGIQLLWRSGRLIQDVWVDWDSLNAPGRREHFIAGNSTRAFLGPFSFPLFITAGHFGGQLFDSTEPVRNGFAGAAGFETRFPLKNFFTHFDAGVLGAGSMAVERGTDGASIVGWGVRVRAGAAPGGVDCSVEWYKGNDLSAPVGNPVYKSNRPILAVEIAKSHSAGRYLFATGGIRLEAIDTTVERYLKNPQYRWWLALRGGFEKRTDLFLIAHR